MKAEISRRSFTSGLLKLLGGTALTSQLGCTTAYLDARFERWKASYAIRFGTIENPFYSIKPMDTDKEIRLLDSITPSQFELGTDELCEQVNRHKKRMEEFQQRYDELSKLEVVTLDVLNECIDQRTELTKLRADAGRAQDRYSALERHYRKTKRKFWEKAERLTREAPEEEFVREVFKGMTGRAFPNDVPIRRRKRLPRGAVAGHYPDKNKIEFIPGKTWYTANILYLLHELGHLCAQHDELGLTREEFSRFNSEGEEISDNVVMGVILEESCAWAYIDAASHHLAAYDGEIATTLKRIFESKVYSHLDALYSQPKIYGRYGQFRGMELFAATRQVLQDPAKVFNYLATLKDSDLKNLDPRIREQMQKNSEVYGRQPRAYVELIRVQNRAAFLRLDYQDLEREITKRLD